jgi:hypothetical protein
VTLYKKINVTFMSEAIYRNFDWEKEVTNFDRRKDVTYFEK